MDVLIALAWIPIGLALSVGLYVGAYLVARANQMKGKIVGKQSSAFLIWNGDLEDGFAFARQILGSTGALVVREDADTRTVFGRTKQTPRTVGATVVIRFGGPADCLEVDMTAGPSVGIHDGRRSPKYAELFAKEWIRLQPAPGPESERRARYPRPRGNDMWS